MPTYDLTSLLTTISSASASFIAILGGLITSKLLTISGEREAVLSKIASSHQLYDSKKALRDTLLHENNEKKALDFIDSNFKSFMHSDDLDTVYNSVKIPPSISIEDLRPFWDRAQELYSLFWNEYKQDNTLTSEQIIQKLSLTHSNDSFFISFHYLFFRQLLILLEENGQNLYLNKTSSFITSASKFPKPQSTMWDTQRIEENTRRIKELDNELGLILSQINQYEEEKLHLQSPPDVQAGLNVFGLFALVCIVFPLILSPFGTTNICLFWFIKLFFIVSFSLGLLSTFLYMKKLLNWPNPKKDNKSNKEV